MKILEVSGENRPELEKVIEHYLRLGDEEKLQAAYFLLGNIRNRKSMIWKNRKRYEILYEFVKAGHSNVPTKAKWDSLRKIYGVNKYSEFDAKSIKANILIDNIDLAFHSWKNMPWGKHYNFKQFCEYILPYRVGDEPLDNWRPYLFKEMKWVMDSLKNKTDIREACKLINDYVDKYHKLMPSMNEVPKLSTIDAFNHPAGICEHRIILLINILRTFAIPCSVDFTPQYTNWAGDHSWVSLIDTTGQSYAFTGGDVLNYTATNKMPMGYGKWEATKVYRQTFSYNDDFKLLFNESSIDVTKEYDMNIGNVEFKIDNAEQEVFLCTFGFKTSIKPVAYTKVQSGTVKFSDVGLNTFYFPAISNRSELIPLANPIFFDSLGNRISYESNKLVTIKTIITRKFPDDGSMAKYGEHILGARIEGSNTPSFKNPIKIHQIDSIPFHFVDVPINVPQQFRYLRYTARDSGCIRLAELEYYSDKGKLNGKVNGQRPEGVIPIESLVKIQDGTVLTWLDAPGKSWVTMDFGKPCQIKKIKYVQRSRINYVEINNDYELFYFDLGWKSLGKQNAKESYLIFDNVPSNAVLLLRNLTQGKEERVFVYESNKQVWR